MYTTQEEWSECLSDNVIYANGMSDAEIGNKIGACIQMNRKKNVKYNFIENNMGIVTGKQIGRAHV